jgi:hypothetical protein
MDHFTSTETARPWWEEVAHLRGDDDRPAASAASVTRAPTDDPFAIAERVELPLEDAVRAPAVAHRRDRGEGRSASSRTRSARSRRPERPSTDWFSQEATKAGRRTKPRVDVSRPERPRATLVDVSPDHSLMRRAPQVRRAPGERPTVTITGRPDAALPPAVREVKTIRARRTREQASSLVSSPDRLILWAVALGLLMILASIGTANADAATPLTLLH